MPREYDSKNFQDIQKKQGGAVLGMEASWREKLFCVLLFFSGTSAWTPTFCHEKFSHSTNCKVQPKSSKPSMHVHAAAEHNALQQQTDIRAQNSTSLEK
jgi:hypothetical protein